MITKVLGYEKYGDIANAKINALNSIIDKWNNTKERVTEFSQEVKDIYANSWMNCIDCAVSDLLFWKHYDGTYSDEQYEQNLEWVKHEIIYEIESTMKRGIDVREAQAVLYPHLA